MKSMTLMQITLGTLLIGGALLNSGKQAYAVGGVEEDNASPHFATQAARDDFEDLSTKVLGGEVRMLRRWVGDHWEWNTRWNDLVLLKKHGDPWVPGSGYKYGDSYSGEIKLCDMPAYIIRNSQMYKVPATYEYEGDCSSYIRDSKYHNTYKRTIKLNAGGVYGFDWADRLGNKIHYGIDGRMEYYENNAGVRVTVERGEDSGEIETVKDHFDNEVIKIVYEEFPVGSEPKEYRVASMHDCQYVAADATDTICTKNREVTYHYHSVNNYLEAVSDVLNPYTPGTPGTYIEGDRSKWADKDTDTHLGWWMNYSETPAEPNLTSYYDPMGRKTTLNIAATGELRNKFNSDGVGASYSSRYDKEKKQFYVSIRDGHGTVTETWYHDLGGVMRKDINGETVVSSEITLSDQSGSTGSIIGTYRLK